MSFDLATLHKQLSEPFPAGDIEWRVSRSGTGQKGVFCFVLAYITARAIQSRLDGVVGPENWCNTGLSIHEVRAGITALQVGISIRCGDQWITKYDVSESTNVEPAKGGFSGAMKRAGAQWGIGRYLYHLDETFAEVSDKGGKGWEYARLPKDKGGESYYWKPPQLPAWALPKESDTDKPVTKKIIDDLYFAWKAKFAPAEKKRDALATGFQAFVFSIVGDSAPIHDPSCWTQPMVEDCKKRIDATAAGGKGPSADVPFV